MSDCENLVAMRGSYQRNNSEVQGVNNENGIDLRSNRQDQDSNHNDGDTGLT